MGRWRPASLERVFFASSSLYPSSLSIFRRPSFNDFCSLGLKGNLPKEVFPDNIYVLLDLLSPVLARLSLLDPLSVVKLLLH